PSSGPLLHRSNPNELGWILGHDCYNMRDCRLGAIQRQSSETAGQAQRWSYPNAPASHHNTQ
ncbi:uncharacterized protein METZ01_LOCUS450816, partial [marine metagenome]